MFENLTGRLADAARQLSGKGRLTESNIKDTLRQVRLALLEADVALPVVRRFIDAVTEKAIGSEVLKSVTPGQQVVKIVNDELVEMLGGTGDDAEPRELNLNAKPPVVIMMVGLQGSGKTTTTAKLAKRLKERDGKRVLMASLDTNRPAAMEQLAILGTQIGVDTLPIVAGEKPVDIAKRAQTQARLGGYDVYMLDTAGRLQIDDDPVGILEREELVANRRGEVEHDPGRVGAGPQAHVLHEHLGLGGRGPHDERQKQACKEFPRHFQQFGWISGTNFNHKPAPKAIFF